VIERVESLIGYEMVREFLALIATARHGIPEMDLMNLMNIPQTTFVPLYAGLEKFLRVTGSQNVIDFFHRQIAKSGNVLFVADLTFSIFFSSSKTVSELRGRFHGISFQVETVLLAKMRSQCQRNLLWL
jgi:hypothetical protein